MGFLVYAKAWTMRVNPFRDGDADTAQVLHLSGSYIRGHF